MLNERKSLLSPLSSCLLTNLPTLYRFFEVARQFNNLRVHFGLTRLT